MSYGDLDSASLLMKLLDEFKKVSGLVPRLPRSIVSCANVNDNTK